MGQMAGHSLAPSCSSSHAFTPVAHQWSPFIGNSVLLPGEEGADSRQSGVTQKSRLPLKRLLFSLLLEQGWGVSGSKQTASVCE